MSKRNRENRARKQKAAQKRRANASSSVPPELMDVRARRRFAIMLPFIYLGQRNPYTPDMVLPDGSIIIGANTPKQGFIRAEHVPQLIAETQDELGVSFDEIVSVIVDSEQAGLMKIVESEPGALARAVGQRAHNQ